MTRISRDAAIAFASKRNFNKGNTKVDTHTGICTLWLFNNPIAFYKREGRAIRLFSCGWRTRTTKDRLNAVLRQFWPKSELWQDGGRWYYKLDRTTITPRREQFQEGLTLDLPATYEIDEDI